MYDQSKLSELIRFARVDAGSTVIDVTGVQNTLRKRALQSFAL